MTLRALLSRITDRRPRLLIATMPEVERTAAFLTAPNNPLWRATLAVLDEKLLEISDRAVDEKLPDAEMRFHLGGQAALMELRVELERCETNARRSRAARET